MSTAAIRFIDITWPSLPSLIPPAWHCKHCGFETRRVNGKHDGKLRVLRPRPSTKRTSICPSCYSEAR